jgi:uncharacterized protein
MNVYLSLARRGPTAAIIPVMDHPLPAQVADASEALAALCREFGVRRLDVFGSAVDGRFDPQSSDLDFVADFEGARRPGYFRAYMGFRRALAELFGREIDLLTEASIVNPYLRRQVEAQRQTLFRSSPGQ